MMELKHTISTLPLSSGVYLMKDAQGQVIYVGKAVSLRKRVQSYFRKNQPVLKTDFLVAEIENIEVLETASEAEALILEASLIKQYQPKYNVDLRDDKSYPFVEITGEEFPRISVQRPRVKKKDAIYYGPYVTVTLMREALNIIRKIFHFRTCDPFPKKECLDYHIGLCDGPCVQKISKKEYSRIVSHVRLILEGKKDDLYRNLKTEMEERGRLKDFEGAAKIRDQLRAIGALYSGTKDINYYKEAEQLERALHLPRLPERIEAFDISNIMGQQAVGSMVSFLSGKPDKNNYRRFRIREVEGIDDFKMIAEVVRRRYRRLKKEGLSYPDLIMIDGGKGQLASAVKELKILDIQIPIVSLAKREEEIFLPQKQKPVVLSKDSLGLKLLQRVRDEAHRFALFYHRSLRSKAVTARKNG
jgi:excinuclease ABC subunit C